MHEAQASGEVSAGHGEEANKILV